LLLRICLISSILLAVAIAVVPQSQRQSNRRVPTKTPDNSRPKAQPTPPSSASEPVPAVSPEPSPVEEQQVETVKIDTNLVTVPVIATSNEGNYIPDLRQEEFNISEDGEKQQVAFFAAVSAPFHVVLLLDTSASTKEKLLWSNCNLRIV
jgi:hypothetical protein